MGNKIGGRRKAGVEERYTRPQGLYEHRDIDQKKLRKLILEAKLAPCYPGADEASEELEECPICFLYYPSLNRSKCCSKGICTECFLQMKPSYTARPTQCPFCKTPNYAVEYRGVKTKEERSIEQFEEQKVIEAQLRMRQQALKDEEDKLTRKQRRCSSSRIVAPTTEVEYRDICSTSFSGCAEQGTESCSSEPSCSTQASMRPFHSRHNRDDNLDMNLEEMMVMEAIWRSIQDRKRDKRLRRKKNGRCMETQEQGNLGNPSCGSYFPVMEAPPCERQAYLPDAQLEIPHPGGYSCAVAALAEHQAPSMDFSYMAGSSTFPVFDMARQPCNMSGGSMCAMENSSLDSWGGIAPTCSREVVREEGECSADHWSEGAEAGTSYAGSDIVADPATMQPLPFPEHFAMAPSHFRPEIIEEQMMFPMAASLAEAHHGRTHAQGLAWL